MIEPNRLRDEVRPATPGRPGSSLTGVGVSPGSVVAPVTLARGRGFAVGVVVVVVVGLVATLLAMSGLDRELTSPYVYLGGYILGAFLTGLVVGIWSRGRAVRDAAIAGLTLTAGAIAALGLGSASISSAVGTAAILMVVAGVPLWLGISLGKGVSSRRVRLA